MKDVINTYGEAVIGMCAVVVDWNVYVCVQKYTFRCDRFMSWIADKGGINEGDN